MHTPISPSCSFMSEEVIVLYSLLEFAIFHQKCTKIYWPSNVQKQFNHNRLKKRKKNPQIKLVPFLYVLIKESLSSLFVTCQSFYAGKGVIYDNYQGALPDPHPSLKKILLEKVRSVVL